ncbi:ATP-binding protein [Nocardia alni]|uniref:ATP-binding protein n=1 Tax=Nocardia alni TaxID=2815723 RepID=UPI001C20FC2F|nr:tetratricopeptide repeat protein [Nocardia alni]
MPGNVRGFVNRLGEIGQLDAVLEPGSGVSVVVIAGTAGVGKTALTLYWAHRHRSRFPGGQLYVNLRGYDPGDPVDPMAVLERFLVALGVPPAAMPAELEARADLYRSLLAERRVLVVLDNAATVGQVRPLLPGSGDCLVLVTSRSRLSGLVARDGAQRVALALLPEPEAVALLRATTAGYRDPDLEVQVAELARLCGRLPLALRIAAERAASRPYMPLTDLIEDLRDESSLWEALSSEAEEEADGVRTVFAWSYRALPADAGRLFRLLGVHPGPEFGAHAAAALADRPVSETRRLLDVLVGTYLLEQTGHDRYQFHDLLRAYAIDQAAEHGGERRAALERICTWYLHTLYAAAGAANLVSWGEVVVLVGPGPSPPQEFTDPEAALAWTDTETDNLVGSAQAASEAGLAALAWRTLVLLHRPYMARHSVDGWLPLGELAVAAAEQAGDPVGQIAALVDLGTNYRLAQRLDESEGHHRRALAIEIDDPAMDIFRRNALGLTLIAARRLDEARGVFERILATAREVADRKRVVIALGNLAETLYELGDPEQAHTRITETFAAMPLDYPAGDRAGWLGHLAMIQRARGHTAEAYEAITEALAINAGRDLLLEGSLDYDLGLIHLAMNQPGQALAPLAHAALSNRRTGTRIREALALDATGRAYQALHRPDEAAEFHRRAAAIHHELRDNWNHALALTHLADALDSLGDTDQARRTRTEALNLTLAYQDPRATQLRHRLSKALHDPDA